MRISDNSVYLDHGQILLFLMRKINNVCLSFFVGCTRTFYFQVFDLILLLGITCTWCNENISDCSIVPVINLESSFFYQIVVRQNAAMQMMDTRNLNIDVYGERLTSHTLFVI